MTSAPRPAPRIVRSPRARSRAHAHATRLLATALAPALLLACDGPRHPRTPAWAIPTAPTPSDAQARAARATRGAPRWRVEIDRLHTLPALWLAMNRQHDLLGAALAEPEPPAAYRVNVPRSRPPETRTPPQSQPPFGPRPGGAESPSTPPDARGRAGHARSRCTLICRHVAAICYAARRICQIARRLQEWAALQTCRRGRRRCGEAHAAARRRCPPCPSSSS